MEARSLIYDVGRLILPAIESMGYDLIEVEYVSERGRWILRLYIDIENGSIKLEDCERVSKAVSAILDVEDIIPGSYNLEVSSPGQERPLRRPKDFQKYSGSEIKIRTSKKIGGSKNFTGVLKGIDNNVVHISSDGSDVDIPLDEVVRARLRKKGE